VNTPEAVSVGGEVDMLVGGASEDGSRISWPAFFLAFGFLATGAWFVARRRLSA
jgi:hypothetical protein